MKATELRDLTDDELQQRHRETRQELTNLSVQKSTGRLEKPSRIRELKRDLARMLTILNERAKPRK